jgi:hypothetical protein
MRRPETWVAVWTQFLKFRAAGLRVTPTRVGNRISFPYNSGFLTRFSAHHTVIALSLQPANRPVLAAELRKHPYELEVLKGNQFSASAVNGVLAESGGLQPAPGLPAGPVVRCAYCGSASPQSEPRCRHCGAVS